MIQIQVINESTCLSDEEIEIAVKALQIQITRDFFPIWGIDAELSFLSSKEILNKVKPDSTKWWCVILDSSGGDSYLGYHELTDAGLPIGKVFALDDIKCQSSWTCTVSHEILEMLGDPYICQAAYDPTKSLLDKIYSYEVCDSPEADNYGYNIPVTLQDGSKVEILVSDFVTPQFFEPAVDHATHVKFDFMGHISKPLEILSGGYLGVYKFGHGWSQINAQIAPKRHIMFVKPGSRRHRRSIERHLWLKSNLKKEEN